MLLLEYTLHLAIIGHHDWSVLYTLVYWASHLDGSVYLLVVCIMVRVLCTAVYDGHYVSSTLLQSEHYDWNVHFTHVGWPT